MRVIVLTIILAWNYIAAADQNSFNVFHEDLENGEETCFVSSAKSKLRRCENDECKDSKVIGKNLKIRIKSPF